MDGLVEGSEEWNAKLRETNSLLLDTIQNNPEMAKYITRDENGNFEITEENQKLAEEEAALDVLNATAANQAAKREQRIANNELTRINMIEASVKNKTFGNCLLTLKIKLL